jgi:general secretion pathway protein K
LPLLVRSLIDGDSMEYLIKNENGIVLFLVLWVLTLLSVIVGEFCHAMRTEVNITRNFKEETQAYYIAMAGVNRAVAELIRSEAMSQKTRYPDTEEEEKEEKEEEEEEEIKWRVNTDIPAIHFGDGQFEVKIGNESGKIDINKADDYLLRMMLNGFELEDIDKDIIVDSILDWRDKNNLHRLNGAEDDYYSSLPEPYECKDDDFDCVEELMLVRGVTAEIFYGGLRDMVTVYPAGFNKININTASSLILRSLPQITDDMIRDIIEYRTKDDFRSLNELIPIVGSDVYKAIVTHITLKTSPYFTIKSVGTLEGGQTCQGVQAMVEINKKFKKGYRLIQWVDGLEHQFREV